MTSKIKWKQIGQWRRITLIISAVLLILAFAPCIHIEEIPVFDPYGVFEKKVSEIPMANWAMVPVIILVIFACISGSWAARIVRFTASLILLIYTTVLIRVLAMSQVMDGISLIQYRYTGFGWGCFLLSSAVFISAAFSLREDGTQKDAGWEKNRSKRKGLA